MTDAIPNRELAVYVVGLLGGEFSRVHTEDIALRCHEVFPDSFSWTKYPDIPDKDIVRVALTDARKPQYGALVEGRSGQKRGQTADTGRKPQLDGWMLTEAGRNWLDDNATRLSEYSKTATDLKKHRQVALRKLRRILEHDLWRVFKDAPASFTPNIGALADLLRCRVDAPPAVWDERLNEIRRLASASENPELIEDFVNRCRVQYEAQR